MVCHWYYCTKVGGSSPIKPPPKPFFYNSLSNPRVPDGNQWLVHVSTNQSHISTYWNHVYVDWTYHHIFCCAMWHLLGFPRGLPLCMHLTMLTLPHGASLACHITCHIIHMDATWQSTIGVDQMMTMLIPCDMWQSIVLSHHHVDVSNMNATSPFFCCCHKNSQLNNFFIRCLFDVKLTSMEISHQSL